MAERAIGVDFGTSTSLLAERSGTLPVDVVPLGRSRTWFPSLAGYRGGQLLLGEDAENLPIEQIIRSVKGAITDGRRYVQITDDSGSRQIDADHVIVSLLGEIARRAEAAGRPLSVSDEVRLGCPAMWDGEQRARLRGLAVQAGLPVSPSALIDEPIAAGIAWLTDRYLSHGERPQGRVLVFDMGGGTLDIAVLEVEGGPSPSISVLSALGRQLAGDRLDTAIAAELTETLIDQRSASADQLHSEWMQAVILREARKGKIQLSTRERHRILFQGVKTIQLPVVTYTRRQLEECFKPQMDEAVRLVWAALRAAKQTENFTHSPTGLREMRDDRLAGDIDYVLLAGGMSRIPYVRRRIGALFPDAVVYDNAGVDADEAIVAGLADPIGYDRLNLHRPGFDFVLEYEEGGQTRIHTVYRAFTPFYSPEDAFTKSFLGYEVRGEDFPGPGHGRARLRVRSVSGEFLRLRYEGRSSDGLNLKLGHNMVFKIYCNGRMVIRDGDRRTWTLRVDQWPVIRGSNHAELVLRQAQDAPLVPAIAWYHEREYAPPGLV
ncbi:Hsp70 family protein [Actinomadura sp. NPDC047616]|uniref:Hsp70 family protein n=1 Tax=Actinomadura sp. NPDC047616 TaxID=3155914 RepID=UPI0033FD1E65